MAVTALDPKTALVVIDLQKGIAAFPTVHPARDIAATSGRLAEAFRAANLPVVLVTVAFSADGGDAPVTRVEVRRKLPPMTPEFSELMPELAASPGDIRIVKRQPNAFYGTELDLQLRRRHVTGIVLCGISTSSGVDGTARAAQERVYNVTFASDAMSDGDAATHEHVLTKVFPRLGEVGTTDEILALLKRQD
jgi:nicotinamidase-related amidase